MLVATPVNLPNLAVAVFVVVISVTVLLQDCCNYNIFCEASVPAPERFFHNQLVDHFFNHDDDNDNNNNDIKNKQTNKYWSQRYYVWEKEFKGPGHPIFMIMGGEGHIPPETGLYYPFVTHHLAKIFGAYVIEPEHRFYGKSQPISLLSLQQQKQRKQQQQDIIDHHIQMNETEQKQELVLEEEEEEEDPRVKLFTSEQALHDYMRLLDHISTTNVDEGGLGCSPDKFSKLYCPVITVGGSYPGFLSALARIMFPQKVDMAYSASAPIYFYSQQVNQYDYYNLITHVAEKIYPGCARGVQTSLMDVKSFILQNQYNQSSLGICEGTIPKYITSAIETNKEDGLQLLVDELMMVVGYTFANDNMGNYPPSNNTRLYKACQTFTSSTLDSFGKFRQFLIQRLSSNNKVTHGRLQGHHQHEQELQIGGKGDEEGECWNMTAQLPTGHDATISSGDWSGVGTGQDGESWDFQTCTLEVEAIGFSPDASVSMFPPRDWSIDWLKEHCQKRFGVTPKPYDMVQKWKFNDLASQTTKNVTRILFTNGLNDGWSVGGIQTNLSDSLIALNFPNGAHHSDLSGQGPTDADSEDIKEGFSKIITILGTWLDEIAPPDTVTTTTAGSSSSVGGGGGGGGGSSSIGL